MEAAEPIWQWAKLLTFLVRRETPSTLRGHMFRAAVRVSGGAEQAERGRDRAFDAGHDPELMYTSTFTLAVDVIGVPLKLSAGPLRWRRGRRRHYVQKHAQSSRGVREPGGFQ
jgi:hypothetical protein